MADSILKPDHANLVAFYPFNKIEETITPDAADNISAIITGGTVVPGYLGNAIQLDGQGNSQEKITTTALSGISSFAVTGWANINWVANRYNSIYIHNPSSGNSNRTRLYLFDANTMTLSIFSYQANTIPPEGTFSFISQYNGATGLAELYINNALVLSGDAGAGKTLEAGQTVIGNAPDYYASKASIDGWVNQFRFFNRPLDGDERAAIANEQASIISGNVKSSGAAAQRTVRVHSKINGKLLDSKISEIDGSYQFESTTHEDVYITALGEAGERSLVHGPITQ